MEKVLRPWDQAVVAEYSYDAWGNLLDWSGPLAERNPIRYRGYYYDTETGFYYLQSRYYDPQTGRFINADDPGFLGPDGDTQGYNLFAYCGNNPTNKTDSEGTFTFSSVAIGAIVGGVVGGLYSAMKGNPVEQVIWDTMIGAASGAASAVGMIGVVGASVINGLNTLITTESRGREMWSKVAISSISTFITGSIGFEIGKAIEGVKGGAFVIGHVVTNMNLGIVNSVFSDAAQVCIPSTGARRNSFQRLLLPEERLVIA